MSAILRAGLTSFSIAALMALVACTTTVTSANPAPSGGDDDDDSGTTSSSSGGTTTANADITTFAASYCDALTPCCPKADAPAAPDTYSSLCRLAVAQGATTAFTKTLADTCLASVKKAAAVTNFCAAPGLFTESCRSLFATAVGKATVGQSCGASNFCAVPANGVAECRSPSNTSGNDICRVETVGNVGDACDATITTSGTVEQVDINATVAANGVVCDGNTSYCDPTTKKCTAIGAVNGSCVSFANNNAAFNSCGMFANCSEATDTPTCVALVAEGAACQSADDCLGNAPCTGGKCGDPLTGLDSVAGLLQDQGGACFKSKTVIGGGG